MNRHYGDRAFPVLMGIGGFVRPDSCLDGCCRHDTHLYLRLHQISCVALQVVESE